MGDTAPYWVAIPGKSTAVGERVDVRVSVIIVNWNTRDALSRALSSIPRDGSVVADVLVVDNASSDGSADMVRSRFPEATLVCMPRNVGFAAANNVAFDAASGDVLLCLNPDAELLPGALEHISAWFADRADTAGVVGGGVVDQTGQPERTHDRFPSAWRVLGRPLRSRPGIVDRALPVDWVTGACLAVRRAVLAAGVRFDEGYPLYVEDVDFCRQARRAGFQVWHDPTPWARHDRGAAPLGRRRGRLRRLGEARFLRKWGGPAEWPIAAAYWILGEGWRPGAYELPRAPEGTDRAG